MNRIIEAFIGGKMKILIIDDEKNIRRILGDYLRRKGFETLEGDGGLHGIELAIQHKDIDLILLDIRMPKMDGYETIIELKEITDAPVIFLTALNGIFDEVKGLDLGSDDYISKPFSYDILYSRINSCLRKHGKLNRDIITIKTLEFDLDHRTVKINKQNINLTPLEFDMLSYLIKNKNITIKREMLLNRLWGYNYNGDPRTVDTHIKTLRAKLDGYSHLIKTIRGVGYQLEILED